MQAEDWFRHAEKRFHASEALYKECVYEDALFMAHQCIELSFKAVIIRKTNELPPRIHSLQRLASIAGYPPTGIGSFADLEPVYVGVRYPDAPEITTSQDDTKEKIKLAQEVLQWSKSQLK